MKYEPQSTHPHIKPLPVIIRTGLFKIPVFSNVKKATGGKNHEGTVIKHRKPDTSGFRYEGFC